jgi:hypothetical protein
MAQNRDYGTRKLAGIPVFGIPGLQTIPRTVSWRYVEQRCNLAQKWPFSSPNRRGQTLTKFKNILYRVLSIGTNTKVLRPRSFGYLFQKAAPP